MARPSAALSCRGTRGRLLGSALESFGKIVAGGVASCDTVSFREYRRAGPAARRPSWRADLDFISSFLIGTNSGCEGGGSWFRTYVTSAVGLPSSAESGSVHDAATLEAQAWRHQRTGGDPTWTASGRKQSLLVTFAGCAWGMQGHPKETCSRRNSNDRASFIPQTSRTSSARR